MARCCRTQVLSLALAEGVAVVGGSGGAGDQESVATGDEANFSSSLHSIPIVDTEAPRKVTMSMRAAGATVVTYLSRGEGKADRRGKGGREAEAEGLAQQSPSVQDLVVTLSETTAREIEACSEIDAIRGKVRRTGTDRSVGVAQSAVQRVAPYNTYVFESTYCCRARTLHPRDPPHTIGCERAR